MRLETLPSKIFLQLYFTFPTLKISIKNSPLLQSMYLIQTSRAKAQTALRKKERKKKPTKKSEFQFYFLSGSK